MYHHLRHLHSLVVGCYDSALMKMAKTTPFRDVRADERLADQTWRSDPVVFDDERYRLLSDMELAHITRRVEKSAGKIRDRVSNLRHALWEQLDRVHKCPRSQITRTADEVDTLFRSESWRHVAPWREKSAYQFRSTSKAETQREGRTLKAPAAATSGNETAATEAATHDRPPEWVADAPPGDSTPETSYPDPPIVLNGLNEEVIVWGTRMGVLTPTQYRVVEALVRAHASGERLTKSQLELRTKDAKGNECDPLGVLRRLREDPVWKQAISMAGKACCGYGLNPPPQTPAHKNTHKRVENHPRPHTGG